MQADNRKSQTSTQNMQAILRWIGIAQVFVSICFLGIGLLLGESRLLICIPAVIFAGIGVHIGWNLPREIGLQVKRQIDQQRKESLQILSLYRHDVMNQVQLIKGYIQLNKFDRIQSPVQKLVQDAQRHTRLANLSGAELPYQLVLRELSAPLVHLQIAWEEPHFQYVSEPEWIEILQDLTQLGEKQAQPIGRAVEWNLVIEETALEILIHMDVLGEDVNDTYSKQLMELFSQHGWSVSYGGLENEKYSLELRKVR